MPFTLSFYIARQFTLYLLMILGIVIGVVLLFDTIELIRVMHGKNINFWIILQMSLMKNMSHIQKTFPFVILISSIITYAKLTRTFELIVARAAGMSVWQFLLPSLITAVLFGFFYAMVFNPITSIMLSKYERMEALYLKGQTSLLSLSKTGLWMRQSDNKGHKSIIHALRASQETKELYDITVYYIDNEGKFDRRIDADRAQLQEGEWLIKNSTITDRQHNIIRKKRLVIPTNLTFHQIQESVIPPEAVSFWKLPSFISITQESGFSALKHEHYFYKLLISPIFYAAMILIGSAFSMSLPRSGRSGMLMSVGIFIGFLIYFLSDLISAVGMSGNMPIILSSIAPTIICLMCGLYLQLHYEDG